MSALSPKARQLYTVLHAQGRTWAGTEAELAALAKLHYPIDRAITSELIAARLIKFNSIGPSTWWLFIFDERKSA